MASLEIFNLSGNPPKKPRLYDSREITIRPIFPDEYLEEIKLSTFYVGTIADRKSTSALLKKLCELFPLPDYTFLKRVKSIKSELKAIICEKVNLQESHSETNIGSIEILKKVLSEKGIDLKLFSTFSEESVPISRPITRTQYQEAVKYWPLLYHEDKEITELQKGTFFSDEEKRQIILYMREAELYAERGSNCGELHIGGVMVDPNNNTVLAKTSDLRSNHLLQHTVMVIVDLIAHGQGGGAWQYKQENLVWWKKDNHVTETSIKRKNETKNQRIEKETFKLSSSSKEKPETADTKETTESKPLCGNIRSSEELLEIDKCNSIKADSINSKQINIENKTATDVAGDQKLKVDKCEKQLKCGAVKAQEVSKQPSLSSAGATNLPYLSTGYDLYITHEPCPMCAMALVHSRIRRVFYRFNTKNGGLGTKHKIHVIQGINHHYQVFQVLYGNETNALNEQLNAIENG